MQSVKEATLSGAKWGAIEKFSVQGIRFVLGIIMARLLAPGDYGVISMLTVFIVLSETFIDSGFANALIRKKEQTQADYSTVFYFNLGIAIVCYLLLFVAAPFIASFFAMDILSPVLRVQSVSLLINALMAVQVTRLTIELNFKAIAIRAMMASLISGIAGVAFAYAGFGVWALVYQTLISCAVQWLFLFVYCRWLPSLTFSRSSFSELFGFGSKLLVANLINKIYSQLSTILIGKCYSAEQLGSYDRGAGLAAMPADNINAILQKVTFPILAKLQDDEDRLISVYRKYIKLMSMVIFFVCMLLVALAKPLILFLLTAKWEAAIIFLQVYTFAVIFNHIDGVNLNILNVKGRSDLVLKLEFWKKGISTIILLASVPFGVLAICISRVLYSVLNIVFDSYYTGKFFGYGLLEQIKDVQKYFWISILACMPAFALSYIDIPDVAALVFGGISAFIVYFFVLRNDEQMKEMLSTLKTKN